MNNVNNFYIINYINIDKSIMIIKKKLTGG